MIDAQKESSRCIGEEKKNSSSLEYKGWHTWLGSEERNNLGCRKRDFVYDALAQRLRSLAQGLAHSRYLLNMSCMNDKDKNTFLTDGTWSNKAQGDESTATDGPNEEWTSLEHKTSEKGWKELSLQK